MSDDGLEELEVRLFLTAIHERYGHDFRDYSSQSVRRRLRVALSKCGAKNLGDLQHQVLVDPSAFAVVLSALTVQVTDLFRDAAFFLAFRRIVVPVLRTHPQIKIWHAGCASGEEVYSTAIVLSEEGLYERSQIYATDISVLALSQAREGVYPETRLADFELGYREAGGQGALQDYYARAYGNLAFRETLRRNMVFFQHDLVSDQAPGEMQVVFCRNVMIYFNDPLRSRVTSKLAAALCRGGFLCLGKDESLPLALQAELRQDGGRHKIFRREAA